LKLAYFSIFATVVAFLYIGMTAKSAEESILPYAFSGWWFLVLCVAYYRKYDK
jgi:hypothetical protein